jgi:hypothetical protein
MLLARDAVNAAANLVQVGNLVGNAPGHDQPSNHTSKKNGLDESAQFSATAKTWIIVSCRNTGKGDTPQSVNVTVPMRESAP